MHPIKLNVEWAVKQVASASLPGFCATDGSILGIFTSSTLPDFCSELLGCSARRLSWNMTVPAHRRNTLDVNDQRNRTQPVTYYKFNDEQKSAANSADCRQCEQVSYTIYLYWQAHTHTHTQTHTDRQSDRGPHYNKNKQEQEGQHRLTGQRATNFRRDLETT